MKLFFTIFFVTAGIATAVSAQTLDISSIMTKRQFRDSGLHKLSPKEQQNLNTWLYEYTSFMLGTTRSSNKYGNKQVYQVEASINDEKFIINGEIFEAKTYCFGLDEGDEVIFLDGSAFGACASAEILDIASDKICKVWCE